MTKEEDIKNAVECMRKGGVILYPTDTVWGIGCLPDNEEAVKKSAAEDGYDISGAQIVDPETSDRTQAYIDKFVELRAKKGMTPEKAKEILHTQYPYYGVMMVKMKDADGMVSGACHSTADTLRPSLQILKTKPGTKLVSAFFLMVVPNCDMGADGEYRIKEIPLFELDRQNSYSAATCCIRASGSSRSGRATPA